jgi:diacylglycerol O-acyltransferase / wax synthase
VKGVTHTHDATVNDVLLTAVAGGLRTLLASRGEPVGGLVLGACVPVSLPREQPGQARGNLDGGMIVPLAIGEPDPVRRLSLIAADIAARKKKSRPPGSTLFRNAAIQRAFLHHAARQRLLNIYMPACPGRRSRCTWPELPLLEVVPIVPIAGTCRLASARCPTPGSSTSPCSRTGTAAQTPLSSPRDYRPRWTR